LTGPDIICGEFEFHHGVALKTGAQNSRLIAVIGAALLLFGCADPASGPAQVDELPVVELDPPENGFQITTDGMWIQPGESVVYCEYQRVGGDINDVHYVRSIEMKATPWVHHILVEFVIPEGVPELGLEASPDEVNYWPLDFEKPDGPVSCGWDDANIRSRHDTYPIGNSQLSEEDVSFPDGTAKIVRGGVYMLVEYHYTNPTIEPIPARVAVNFHVAEPPPEHLLAGFIFSYNNIDVPPHTQKSHAAQCVFEDDYMVWGLKRHTHEFATAFHIWHAGGEKDGEYIWSSFDWDDQNFLFPEGRSW